MTTTPTSCHPTDSPTPPARRRPRAAAIAAVTLLVLAAGAGLHASGPKRASPGPEPPPSATAPPPPPTAPPTTVREQHPLVALMARYDRLYARIVGDRRILYNAQHPAHREVRGLLTPDSPLDTRIFGGFRTHYPPGLVQAAGATRPDALAPGEHNARLPMIHELLGPLPHPDRRGTVTVPACVHLDNRILDTNGLAQEWAHDGRQDARITFRRVHGRWRLHTFVWERGPCYRCGPEPPGTARINTYINGRPRPSDPPCDDGRRP